MGPKDRRSSTVICVIDDPPLFVVPSPRLPGHAFRYDIMQVNNMPQSLAPATRPPRAGGGPVIPGVRALLADLLLNKKPSSGERYWPARSFKIRRRWADRSVRTGPDRQLPGIWAR
jgi:hypothetical protein